MAKQLIVSVNGREKKIAIIEDDKVAEFYIERGEQHQGIVGNIYKGRVMRVLPGMQSAFVDIGLERDAFLYVSDFFDEEEEFERIVIDKSKKGAQEPEHAAAQEVALNRVEREQQIEATQERIEAEEGEAGLVEEVAEPADAGRRRSRRGRRRGRWEKGDDVIPSAQPSPRFEIPDTPFVAADPSIERIVDEEETAAVNGEMFKDARLQERIFDQIHAVEFNMEDDFSSAEVGSLLSSGFGSDAFERIDDGESDAEPVVREGQRPREAHVSSFVDDVSSAPLSSGGFERISDDEEEAAQAIEAEAQAGKKSRKSAAKKRTKPAAATKTASKKKASSKKPSKKRAASAEGETEQQTGLYSDAEASVTESQSRGEFATRRGGRRRRRPSKNKAGAAPAEAEGSPVDGQDDEVEQIQAVETQEEVVAAPAPPERRQREHREQRRDQRGHRGQSRRERYQPAITDLLDEGQEILVQIAKEPIAKKGARITSHIALPGRFLVYMPTVEHVGVSRKIESDSERHRLRKLIQTIRAEEDIPSGGFIVRTAGVGINEKDLREDVRYLVRTWLDIRGSAEKSKAPSLVHKDLDLVQRLLRDQLSDDFESIRVDSEEEYQAIVEFV
ncbi:MAG TPA: ribonuclease E/G, partial [Pyrinomonadaceae bacterium]|nr:ribonuclease E/G [Pyrinomonadaceae bacterium]